MTADSSHRALAVADLRAGYGQTEVVHGIDLYVEPGEIVAILGPNGAGKTTTLLAIAGAIRSRGSVEMFGRRIAASVHKRAAGGLAFLPDTRGVIRGLTVEQNLRVAGVSADEVYETSPELRVCHDRMAGALSGGEQQILALTRAIVSKPALLLADEMSFGLAPGVVTRMFQLIQLAAAQGTGTVIVEQYAHRALEVADRAYVLQRGKVALQGVAKGMLSEIDTVESAYLRGTGDPETEGSSEVGGLQERPSPERRHRLVGRRRDSH